MKRKLRLTLLLLDLSQYGNVHGNANDRQHYAHNIRKIYGICFVFTGAAQCGKSNPYGVQKRVVSGRSALPGAWPWQVKLHSITSILPKNSNTVCMQATRDRV